MKFNGKKAIMAAVLSAIVAASSFGTAIMADAATTYYTIKMGMTFNHTPQGKGPCSLEVVDANGNYFPGDCSVPGQTYQVVVKPGDGYAVLKITIDDIDVCYPNATGGTYYYPFTMPAHDCSVHVTFGAPSSLTPPTPKPTPDPDPTPSPTPEPTSPTTPTEPTTPTTPTTPDVPTTPTEPITPTTPTAPAVPTTPTKPTTPAFTYQKGDVNLDGKVNVIDATLILKHSVQLITLNSEQLDRADVNGDWRVNAADATLILKMSVGLA